MAKYNELSEAGKETARDQWREGAADFDDWHEFIYDDFKERMQEKGIDVTDIYFLGFYSQGDGACFEGSINDFKKFLDAHYQPEEKPAIRAALNLDDFGLSFTSRHTGRYYHAYSVSFTMEGTEADDLNPFDVEADQLRHAVFYALHKLGTLDNELATFEEEASEIFRDHMKQLYKELEEEHESLQRAGRRARIYNQRRGNH